MGVGTSSHATLARCDKNEWERDRNNVTAMIIREIKHREYGV